MAQFTIYRSTDTSAPVLTGEVGKLNALLKACLVDGYGSQPDQGWTEEFTQTNGSVFRPASGARHYWQVNDAAPSSATDARSLGFETMSAWATGTALFPTAVQRANGLFIRKSAAASATARAWIVAADGYTCYLFILTGDTAGRYYGYCFGDMFSYGGSGDAYRTIHIAKVVEADATISNEALSNITDVASVSTGHYMPRSYTTTGAALNVSKSADRHKSNTGGFFGVVTYPNGPDSGLHLTPLYIAEIGSPANIRGRLRGLWAHVHPDASFADGDTFTGTGDLAGKTFLIIKGALHSVGAVAGGGAFIVETSDTVETN